MRVCALQIFSSIDTDSRRLIHESHSHCQTCGEWTKLLEALDLFERMRREGHPRSERVARIRIDADMLPDARASQVCLRCVTQERNGRPRKIHRSAIIGSDNLDDARLDEDLLPGTRGRRPEGKIS